MVCIFARQALIKLYLLMTRVSDVRSDLGNDEAGGKGEGSAGKGQPTGQLSPTGAISHLALSWRPLVSFENEDWVPNFLVKQTYRIGWASCLTK